MEYGDGTIAIVYPVPQSQSSLFNLLAQRLLDLWLALDGHTDELVASVQGWQLIEAIAKLIRSEKVLPFKLAPLKKDLALLERLFLYVGESAGELVQLHLYQSKQKEQPTEGEDGAPTIAALPFPTTGDNDYDTIGSLLVRWTPSEVQRLLQWLDAEALDNVLSVMGELSRNPDERLQEFVEERDRRLLDANRIVLNKALGLPDYYGSD